MSSSTLVRIVLAFVLCVFATVIIRHGPVEPASVGERIAITAIWVVGVAYMIWTVARKST